MNPIRLNDWITLYWYKPTDKGIRYYTARLHQDLWGSWILTRTWGRKGTRLGTHMNAVCESYTEGLQLLETVRRTRTQHGYDLDGGV